MKKMLNSKKGDIPTMLLVIATLALFVFALFTFYLSNLNVEKKINLAKMIDSIHVKEEQFYFYKKIGRTNEEAAELIDGILDGNSILIKRDFYSKKGLFFPKKKFIMSIEYRFPILN